VTLIELPFGGLMADTPGFNQPTLDRVASTDLAKLFPEFNAAVEAQGGCRCVCYHLICRRYCQRCRLPCIYLMTSHCCFTICI
jgi:putative ribosome biogenesis GTPase RsgA